MDASGLIRNVVACVRCRANLVVECCASDGLADGQRSAFSFSCPACRGWNEKVHLRGERFASVFLDPRGRLNTHR